MPIKSAGILLFKRRLEGMAVLLVHPSGPFWSRRDAGAWSIPKGEYADGEAPEVAARREFREETGADAPWGLLSLGSQRRRSGKLIIAFASEGDFSVDALQSNSFEMEWPPRSGRAYSFAEVDRAQWFTFAAAREKIVAGQRPFLIRLQQLLAAPSASPEQSDQRP